MYWSFPRPWKLPVPQAFQDTGTDFSHSEVFNWVYTLENFRTGQVLSRFPWFEPKLQFFRRLLYLNLKGTFLIGKVNALAPVTCNSRFVNLLNEGSELIIVQSSIVECTGTFLFKYYSLCFAVGCVAWLSCSRLISMCYKPMNRPDVVASSCRTVICKLSTKLSK